MSSAKARSVEGVINGPPAGMGAKRGWIVVFELVPWRVEGQSELSDVPLRVEIPVAKRELDRWLSRLDDGMKVRVPVKQVGEVRGKPWWLAAGRLPVKRIAGSAKLAQAQAARAKPVVIDDEVLGRLELERSLHWFEGKRSFGGRRYHLAIHQSGAGENPARDQRDIVRARAIVRRLEARVSTLLSAIARDKLSLYNDNWRENRPRLSRAAFLARLRLSDIVIHADGAANVYFKDGGLFLGHMIEVRVGKKGAISETCLAG